MPGVVARNLYIMAFSRILASQTEPAPVPTMPVAGTRPRCEHLDDCKAAAQHMPSSGCCLVLRLYTHAAGGPSQQLLNEYYQQQTQQLQPQLQALPAQHIVGAMTQPAVKVQPQTASKPMSAQQAASRLAAGGSLQPVPPKLPQLHSPLHLKSTAWRSLGVCFCPSLEDSQQARPPSENVDLISPASCHSAWAAQLGTLCAVDHCHLAHAGQGHCRGTRTFVLSLGL